MAQNPFRNDPEEDSEEDSFLDIPSLDEFSLYNPTAPVYDSPPATDEFLGGLFLGDEMFVEAEEPEEGAVGGAVGGVLGEQ